MVPRKISFPVQVAAHTLSLLLILSTFLGALQPTSAAPKPNKRVKSKAAVINKNKLLAIRKKAAQVAPRREGEEEEQEKDNKFKEDPGGRRDWFTYERTYPFDEMPVEGRRQAWEAFQSGDNFSEHAEATAPSWQAIGPRPTFSGFPQNWGVTSGRINAIAISPANTNLILVGAATGGVWRSEDGGNSFEPVSDNHVDLAVGAITFAPGDPNTVYAGMGDLDNSYLGTGVLKSTDAGKTWKRVSNNTLPAPGYIVSLQVDPKDANRVYAAQFARLSNGSLFASGFFLSSDGGVNWKRTLIGLPSDCVVSPADSNTIYTAMLRVDQVGNLGPGVYRSTNSGETWSLAYAAPFPLGISDLRLAVTAADPGSIYAFTGGGNAAGELEIRLSKSKDGGTTWSSKVITDKIDTGQFGYNTYVAVDPQNADTVYVGTRDVFKTTDGGNTWTNLNNNFTLFDDYTPDESNTHPDQHTLAFVPGQANTFFIGNDGGLYKSTNGGRTFTSQNQSLSLSQVVGMDISPFFPDATLIGTQDNGTQVRDTGDWYEIASGDGGATLFSPTNPAVFYTSYVYGTMYRFDLERGRVFGVGSQRIFGEFTAGTPRINFYPPIEGTQDGRLYFGSWRLFISRNNGDAWYTPGWAFDLTKGTADRINAIGVSNFNSKVIYTGSRQGRVMVSQNSGNTWKDITAGLPNRTVKSITTNPKNPAIAYLTLSGYASPHVYKTSNFGATWTNISSNLPDIPTSTFVFDPVNPQIIYVGTDVGVFRSIDDGQTWENFNKGMPPAVVTKLVAHPSGIIQAGTYGRGVYEINVRPTIE